MALDKDGNEIQGDDILSPEAQEIFDRELAKENGTDYVPPVKPTDDEDGDDKLPSDDDGEDTLFANKYENVDELKKGIKNIGSTLPDYVIEGMSDSALEQHYLELNKEKSSGDDKKGRKHASDDTPKEDEKPVDRKPEQIDTALWNELETSFNDTGKITGEQYDKLNKAGIPDEVVDKYIDSLHNDQVRFTEKVYEIAGGEEEYGHIKTWAESNLSEQEIDAIGKMDYASMLIALEGVKARYTVATGGQHQAPLRGSGARQTGGTAYKNEMDYIRDVSDPRYNTDIGFREKVMAKLKRSNLTS